MGVWGVGLCSNDLAEDLNDTIRALSRLPLTTEEIITMLCEEFSAASDRDDDFEHATFWLVVADQFSKRGIAYEPARERALRILAEKPDIRALRAAGMTAAFLRAREKNLEKLRATLAVGPMVERPRRVLKKPQPFVLEVGDVMTYPTSQGQYINPYYTAAEALKFLKEDEWEVDAWQVFVIVERGREYGLIPWYRCMHEWNAFAQKPTLTSVSKNRDWVLEAPGTFPKSHIKRMRMEHVGRVAIDEDKFAKAFPDRRSARSKALGDIPLACCMGQHGGDKSDALRGLGSILR